MLDPVQCAAAQLWLARRDAPDADLPFAVESDEERRAAFLSYLRGWRFPAEMEILLATLTVEQREVAEIRLQSWEEILVDDGATVYDYQRLAVLRQIVSEFR